MVGYVLLTGALRDCEQVLGVEEHISTMGEKHTCHVPAGFETPAHGCVKRAGLPGCFGKLMWTPICCWDVDIICGLGPRQSGD